MPEYMPYPLFDLQDQSMQSVFLSAPSLEPEYVSYVAF